MTSMSCLQGSVFGGVDTHKDLHMAALVDETGTVIGTHAFSTTRAGYRPLLRWMSGFGQLQRVGVEQTGSYGAGVVRHLALAGVPVLEVTGTDKVERRSRGKDDTLDAIVAARAALEGKRISVAKQRDGEIEALRVLRVARQTSVKSRRSALQLLRMMIIAAPDEVRDQTRNLTRMQLIRTAPAGVQTPTPAQTRSSRPGSRSRASPAGSSSSTTRSQTWTSRSSSSSVSSTPDCSSRSGSASRSPASCSSPPATTPSGCAARPASRCSAASRRSPRAPA